MEVLVDVARAVLRGRRSVRAYGGSRGRRRGHAGAVARWRGPPSRGARRLLGAAGDEPGDRPDEWQDAG